MTDENLEAMAKRAGEQLRASEFDVPADVQEKLVAARRKAVARVDQPVRPRRWLWLPAGGVAAAMVVGLMMLPRVDDSVLPADNLVAVVEADEVFSELALLDELEFVAWMVEEDAIHPG